MVVDYYRLRFWSVLQFFYTANSKHSDDLIWFCLLKKKKKKTECMGNGRRGLLDVSSVWMENVYEGNFTASASVRRLSQDGCLSGEASSHCLARDLSLFYSFTASYEGLHSRKLCFWKNIMF